MAPEPTPRSSTVKACGTVNSASASCTTVSVSGRGESTPGPTPSMIVQKPLRPRMRLTGSRLARRVR